MLKINLAKGTMIIRNYATRKKSTLKQITSLIFGETFLLQLFALCAGLISRPKTILIQF